jgi:hypothetical protein
VNLLPSLTRHPVLRFATLAAAVLCAGATTRADNWQPNFTTGAVWHNNATNATGLDQIDSLQLRADLLAAQKYPLGRDDALQLSGHLGGDWWPRYNGLMTGAAGGRAEWRHTFGIAAHAPVFSVGGAADAIGAKETGRRGVATGLTAALSKRFNDLTRGTLSHEVTWMAARYGTYDAAASETKLEIDRDLNDLTRITFAGLFRDGDIVTYAEGTRPDLVALAPHRLDVDTFGRPMTAYRVDARTWGAKVAFARALDPDTALIVAYEWRDTKRQTLSFTNNLLSIALVHQF